MNLEALYLVLALVALTSTSAWINTKADGPVLQLFTLALLTIGLLGIPLLILASLFGWPIPGGAS